MGTQSYNTLHYFHLLSVYDPISTSNKAYAINNHSVYYKHLTTYSKVQVQLLWSSDVVRVVCSSSICGFWLPLWYLQTPLTSIMFCRRVTYIATRHGISRCKETVKRSKVGLLFTSTNNMYIRISKSVQGLLLLLASPIITILKCTMRKWCCITNHWVC
jgi:hypothetical protein